MAAKEASFALDQIRFLSRAESRVGIIEHLVESGEATQRELRAELEASRTTVSRSLQSLAERGWIERSNGAYRLTHSGQTIAQEFARMLDAVEAVDELSEFLRLFPSDVDAPDFLDADDVDVTYSTDADPYAPARKQTEVLHTADRIRVLLPAIDLDSTRTITEQVTERGLEVETIVSPDVESVIESDEFSPLIREKMATERSTVYVAESALPFYLGLTAGGFVQIGLADEEGLPRALFETTDETIGEWARAVYEDYRETARRKSIEEF